MPTLNLLIELTDEQATGIAQARTAYNNGLPDEAPRLTDTEYMVMVNTRAATSYANQYAGSDPVPPSPVEPVPDWDGLLNQLLDGDLYQLFRDITLASVSNSALLIARNDIFGVLSNPKIGHRELALKSGLDMVALSGYEIPPNQKDDWNRITTQLNFSELVRL